MLQCLLKELPPFKGSVTMRGTVAYVSQEPWIFSSTVRENILFGSKYEDDWYYTVLEACALKRVKEREREREGEGEGGREREGEGEGGREREREGGRGREREREGEGEGERGREGESKMWKKQHNEWTKK